MSEEFFVPGAFYMIAHRQDVEPGADDALNVVSVGRLKYIRHDGDSMVLLFSDRYLAEDYLESIEDLDYVVARFGGFAEMAACLAELSKRHSHAVVDKAPRGRYGMVIRLDALVETIRQQLISRGGWDD